MAAPSPRAQMRMLVGFVAVPPAAGLAVAAVCAAFWSAGYHLVPRGVPIDMIPTALSLGFAASILAFFVTIFGALPAVGWLAGRARLTLRRVLLLGAVLGNAPFVLVTLALLISRATRGTPAGPIADSWYGVPGMVRTIAFGLAAGMGAAAVFWVIAVRGTELDAD